MRAGGKDPLHLADLLGHDLIKLGHGEAGGNLVELQISDDVVIAKDSVHPLHMRFFPEFLRHLLLRRASTANEDIRGHRHILTDWDLSRRAEPTPSGIGLTGQVG